MQRPTGNRRRVLAPSLVTWQATLRAPSPRVAGIATTMEVGGRVACVRGIRIGDGDEVVHDESSVCVLNAEDVYTTDFRPVEDGGIEHGFTYDADHDLGDDDHGIRFPTTSRAAMRDLGDVCRFAQEGRAEAVLVAIRAVVARRGQTVVLDPMLRAKRALDAHFAKPLYVGELAEIARVHPHTFARKFAARFGVTPARYRVRVRITAAWHLLFTEPHTPVAEVARRCGFDDASYFHRAFVAALGVAPGDFRLWMLTGVRPLLHDRVA